jgi:hypothetical protein
MQGRRELVKRPVSLGAGRGFFAHNRIQLNRLVEDFDGGAAASTLD